MNMKNTAPPSQPPTIYSEQAQPTDYILIKGIRTRLGIKSSDFDFFIVKELIDNALDFIDSNSKKFAGLDQNPYVHLIISEEKEDEKGKKITKIAVRNSNAGLDVFSNEQVERIFDFERYYSSKRNKYQISRGILGGAFKEILGIPYALAFEDIENTANYEGWKYPLQINIANERSIEVRIDDIDKIKKTVRSKIDIKNIRQRQEEEEQDKYTEIIVYIPKQLDYDVIQSLFLEYVSINTHIDFKFKSPKHSKKEYQATQEIKDWKNKQSIYYYSLNEFKDLIRGFEKKSNSLNVYENLIHTDFIEGRTIVKDKDFQTLTFDDLERYDEKIEDLYYKLKGNLKSIKNQSSSLSILEVPFDIKQNIRQEALKQRFQQTWGYLDGFAYKRLNGYFGPDVNNIEFPFIVEIIVANVVNYAKRLILSESVNLSPSLYANFFTDEDRGKDVFTWTTKSKETKLSHSITEILKSCGYDYDQKKHKKSNNFVYINLISPRIDYKTGGKLKIDLKPFASIAQDLYKFCKS